MEPNLEDISDYNTLKGEKKRVVWSVIIVGILLGIGYLIAYKVFNDSGDAIKTNDTIKVVPLSKNLPIR
jgi:predicted negative regulator of RcsB-dependent stress response